MDMGGFSGGMSLRAPSRGMSGMGSRTHRRSLSSNLGWGQQQTGRSKTQSFSSANEEDIGAGDEEESFETLVQNWQHIQGTAFIYVSPPSVNAKAFGVASVWTMTNSDGSKKDAFLHEMGTSFTFTMGLLPLLNALMNFAEDAENAVFARREQQMLALKQHIILCSLQDALYMRSDNGTLASMDPKALQTAIKEIGEDPVGMVRRILTKLKQRVCDASAAVVDNWYTQLRNVLDAFALLSESESANQGQEGAGGNSEVAVAESKGRAGGLRFEGVRPAAHKILSDDEYERQLLGYHHSTKSGRLRGYSCFQEDVESRHHRVNTATEMLTAALQGARTEQFDIPSLIGASAESRRLLRHRYVFSNAKWLGGDDRAATHTSSRRSLVKLACDIEPGLSSLNFEVLAEAAYQQAQESFKERRDAQKGIQTRPHAQTLSSSGSQSIDFSGGVCFREK